MSKKFILKKEYEKYCRENIDSGVDPMCLEEFYGMILDFIDWGELNIRAEDIEMEFAPPYKS